MIKPIFLRRIEGVSMLPTLKPNQIIVASGMLRPKIGSVVIARWNQKEIIKRVVSMEADSVNVAGDNTTKSLKVRLPHSAIIGVKV